MPRATNLDNIAPDDPIDTIPTGQPPSTPLPPKKKKHKIHSSSPSSSTPVNESSVKPTPSPVESIRAEIDNILSHAKSSLGSFQVKPRHFEFSEQEKDEKIILVMRQHWFTNVRWILITILLILAPLALTYVPILSFFPPSYQMVSVLFWYLITFAFAFEQFLSWYFNLYIITDERVVDIDFLNLLNKRFSDAKINMIQDVTSQVSGLSQTILNYGNILIQTAAEQNQFVFEKVPNPDIVTKILQQLRQEEEQEALEGRTR